MRELETAAGIAPEEMERVLHQQFWAYRATLQDDRRRLLERFEIVDMARKVVRVAASTRAFIALLQGRDQHDPLFLQVKEATRSVLEGQLPRAATSTRASGWSKGQRMPQAASDIFLGWTRPSSATHHYWRQLRDMKGSTEVEAMAPVGTRFYRRHLRLDPGPGRPLRRPHRHRRLPR